LTSTHSAANARVSTMLSDRCYAGFARELWFLRALQPVSSVHRYPFILKRLSKHINCCQVSFILTSLPRSLQFSTHRNSLFRAVHKPFLASSGLRFHVISLPSMFDRFVGQNKLSDSPTHATDGRLFPALMAFILRTGLLHGSPGTPVSIPTSPIARDSTK
jgi:hypothetical protein